jgi:hypothetical protein
MKTSFKLAALFSSLLTTVTLAQAEQVTFQVNMAAQTALGNFDPSSDSVVVAGDPLNNWSTSASPLASSVSDTNIWVGTFAVSGTFGATAQYKFVMNTSQGTVWEGQVGTGGTTANRAFVISNIDEVLPVVYFNNVTNSVNVTNLITFRLDMGIQILLGNFNPAAGSVNIAGAFNNWSASATPLTNSITDTNVWSTTLSFSGADASPVDFKFIMSGTWENNNVGPGGTQNRVVTLAKTDQVLPVIYFNNVTNVPVPTPLDFQVNLAVQTALGNFNPSTDTVEARGSFNNNWAGGFVLTNSPDNPNLFSGTWVDSTDVVGATIQYQFVLNGGTWETAVGNRNYMILSTNEQSVPLVFFNNVNNLGPLSLQTTNGQAMLSWTAGPGVRLQSGISLINGWQDVPNTQGSNSLAVPLGAGQKFFRLIGP